MDSKNKIYDSDSEMSDGEREALKVATHEINNGIPLDSFNKAYLIAKHKVPFDRSRNQNKKKNNSESKTAAKKTEDSNNSVKEIVKCKKSNER